MSTLSGDADVRIPNAIPTVYRGISLKSRFEAQAALLFDSLGWEWEYEPHSFMLSNGVAYTPDFLIPNWNMFVECRGYDSEKGRMQLDGFAELVGSGDGAPFGKDGEFADRFLILYGDSEARLVLGKRCVGMAMLVHCKDCGWTTGGITSEPGLAVPEAYCSSCIAPMLLPRWHKWDGKTRIDRLAVITVSKGKILVNGAGSQAWDSILIVPNEGHEPFNLGADEMDSEWDDSE